MLKSSQTFMRFAIHKSPGRQVMHKLVFYYRVYKTCQTRVVILYDGNTSSFGSDRVRVPTQSESVEREAMTVATVLPGRRRDGEPGHVEVRACRQGPNLFVSTSEVEVKERGPPSLVVQRRRQHRTRETVTLRALRRHLLYAADLRHFGLLGDVGTERLRAALRIRRRRRFPNHLQRRVGGHGRPGHIPRFVNIRDEAADVHVFIVAARRGVGQPRSLGHVAPTRIVGRALVRRPVTDLRAW